MWVGGRLAGALKNKVNYFGTDPNYLLVDKLKEFAKDYQKINWTKSGVDIRCQGSEKFIPEWEGKIGLAFSSPPYFLLEDYKIGDQSYKSGITTYDMWLNDYLKPTMQNIYKYLTIDGYFVINIKDFDKYALEKDTVRIAQECGFELYKIEELSQSTRVSGNVANSETQLVDVDESVYVFIKQGVTPKECHPVQLSLFDM